MEVPDSDLNRTLDTFMSTTGKSKVAVIVPMFGYWADSHSHQLTAEVLSVVLNRVHSEAHQLYIIFCAESSRLTKSVGDVLMGHMKGGNVQGTRVEVGSTYGDYIHEGIVTALESTDAQYILILNPWVILQHGGIDAMVDRINRGDAARLISGYDLHKVIDAEQFDQYKAQIAKEERDMSFNFLGMARYTAEMLEFDENFKTHSYLERDTWQEMFSKGYEVITSQTIPIFSFDIEWEDIEPKELIDTDKEYFSKKWGFDPGIK